MKPYPQHHPSIMSPEACAEEAAALTRIPESDRTEYQAGRLRSLLFASGTRAMTQPANEGVDPHPYSYMRWHRLAEVTSEGETVELNAAASCDGIPVIASWKLKDDGTWAVVAFDGEGQEWRSVDPAEVESGEDCVPLTPPPIWSDGLMASLSKADKVLDDIDTAGDAFKPEHTPYFKYVARRCQDGDMLERRKLLGLQECPVGERNAPPAEPAPAPPGGRDSKLDAIYGAADLMMRSGDVAGLRTAIIRCDRGDIDALMGWLSATLPYRTHPELASTRRALYEAAKERLMKNGEDWASELIGLEPPEPSDRAGSGVETPRTDAAERSFREWTNLLRDRDPNVRASAASAPVLDGFDFARELEGENDAFRSIMSRIGEACLGGTFDASEATPEFLERLVVTVKNRIGSGWQPIESAPRDGTIIDLWIPDPPDDHRCPDCEWRDGGWVMSHVGVKLDWIQEASHWMPLPPAPDIAGKEER